MDRVGASIRAVYHWVPPTQKCYLVMDNAGGHGTEETIEEYVRMLGKSTTLKQYFKYPDLRILMYWSSGYGVYFRQKWKNNILANDVK